MRILHLLQHLAAPIGLNGSKCQLLCHVRHPVSISLIVSPFQACDFPFSASLLMILLLTSSFRLFPVQNTWVPISNLFFHPCFFDAHRLPQLLNSLSPSATRSYDPKRSSKSILKLFKLFSTARRHQFTPPIIEIDSLHFFRLCAKSSKLKDLILTEPSTLLKPNAPTNTFVTLPARLLLPFVETPSV